MRLECPAVVPDGINQAIRHLAQALVHLNVPQRPASLPNIPCTRSSSQIGNQDTHAHTPTHTHVWDVKRELIKSELGNAIKVD